MPTLETQSVDYSLTQPFEISAEGGTITRRVSSDTSNPDSTVITAETQYPAGLEDTWRITRGLDPTPPEEQSESSLSQLIGLTSPRGFMHEFTQIRRFQGVLRALGYDWSHQESTENSVTTTNHMLSYPSVDALNSNAARIFPSTPIKFIPFTGGRYRAEDYLVPFAEAGEIIVPDEQPWELHDHAVKHLLAMLAMGEDFVEPMQTAVKQWLVRDAGEAALPPVPGMDKTHVATFVRPSQAALSDILYKFDFHTVEIAQALLIKSIARYMPHIHRDRWEKVVDPIQRFWNDGKSNFGRSGEEVPSNFLGHRDYYQALRLGETMWKRFEAAEANAAALEDNYKEREAR